MSDDVDIGSFTDANELIQATGWTTKQAKAKVKAEIEKTMKEIKQAK